MDKIFEQYIDKDYKVFSEKLIPNSNILGIRAKDLSLIAKEYIKNNDYSILEKELFYHEEKMVYMLILSHLKDMNLVYEKLDKLVPQIDNWAICDSLNHVKKIRKNRELFHGLIDKYKNSKNEFEVRFVLIILLFHYMEEEYLDEIFEIMESVNTYSYYAKMGLAWLLSECFVKYRDYTIKRISGLKIDDYSFNKGIQKIRESYRVSDSDKEYLKSLKR